MSSQLFELEESADDILLDETVSDTVPTETTIVLDDDTAENNRLYCDGVVPSNMENNIFNSFPSFYLKWRMWCFLPMRFTTVSA